MIKRFANGQAQLWTKDGKRPLGKETTLAEAKAQERAISIYIIDDVGGHWEPTKAKVLHGGHKRT